MSVIGLRNRFARTSILLTVGTKIQLRGTRDLPRWDAQSQQATR